MLKKKFKKKYKNIFNNNEQDQIVSYIRRTEFRQYDQIYNDQQYLLGYFSKDKGRYEDYKNSVLVNFADKNVGGLSFDPVNIAQEEVLILTHPEAVISMLFMQTMDENEAILIQNIMMDTDRHLDEKMKIIVNQFSKIQKLQKSYLSNISQLISLCYKNWQMQFDQVYINRELTKSYVAFSLELNYTNNENISTGKWGCGIFNGDVQLKILILLPAFLMAQQDWQQKHEQNKMLDFKNKTERILIFSSFHNNQFDDLIYSYEKCLNEKRLKILQNNNLRD
ncbi:unnamed protein product [Paramecium primaurelia]|uniref:PARG catalytic Macro domain-containing protein n=1 Tax=Paramecium primaurelia TaxID=5886 RepID=A0A8S1QEZ6_PARPR|nr:unnamed protein product [Paramecium primaurelia]